MKALSAKLQRLARIANREQVTQEPIITCHWGDEHIEHEPGTTIIKTKWGRGTDPRKKQQSEEISNDDEDIIVEFNVD